MKRFVCLLMMISFSLAVFAQENLALNGDFEQIADEFPSYWSSDGWHNSPMITRFYVGTANPYSGKYYVGIENVSENDARFIQTVKVTPDSVYKLSGWVRAKVAEADKVCANITVFQNNFFEHSSSIQDTGGEWEYVEFRVRTGADQRRMDVCLRLGSFGSVVTGFAEFDNFRVEMLQNAGVVGVANLGSSAGEQAAVEQAKPFSALLLIFLILVIGGIAAFVVFTFVLKPKVPEKGKKIKGTLFNPEETQLSLNQVEKVRYTKLDFILCGVVTLVYIGVAFTHLGSFVAPQTHWKPATIGESFYVDFGAPKNISRFMYFEGIPNGHTQGKFKLEASDDADTWRHLASFTPSSIFFWFQVYTGTQARYVRVIAEVPNVELKEMAFFEGESLEPLKITRVVVDAKSVLTQGEPANVFDEQQTIPERPTMMNGMPTSFDELYHARTAYEHLHKIYPYETTHPPLGKIIIALGIQIFGMIPFGWRFMGTTFGVLMVIMMYLLGKQLFKKSEYALMCAFLMACDFMHFLHTRIATVDSYVVFFVILMYYFMYQYYTMDFYKEKFTRTLRPLFFSGLFWGIGVACKWNSLFAGFGLAFIFFLTIAKRIAVFRYNAIRLRSKKAKIDPEERQRLTFFQQNLPRDLLLTIGWCVLVFIAIPMVIYVMAYVPYMMTLGGRQSNRSMWDPRNLSLMFNFRNLSAVWREQLGMWNYHSQLDQGHPSTSPWWQWPVMWVNFTYHVGQGLPPGKTETVIAIGNPAVWWVGTLAALVSMALSIYRLILRIVTVTADREMKKRPGAIRFNHYLMSITDREKAAFFITVAFLSQYLPWALSPRELTFIYHFFPSVPFIILATVYLIREFILVMSRKGQTQARLSKVIVFFYLGIALLLFIMFYPVIAGQIVDRTYVETYLKWLPNWRIY